MSDAQPLDGRPFVVRSKGVDGGFYLSNLVLFLCEAINQHGCREGPILTSSDPVPASGITMEESDYPIAYHHQAPQVESRCLLPKILCQRLQRQTLGSRGGFDLALRRGSGLIYLNGGGAARRAVGTFL